MAIVADDRELRAVLVTSEAFAEAIAVLRRAGIPGCGFGLVDLMGEIGKAARHPDTRL